MNQIAGTLRKSIGFYDSVVVLYCIYVGAIHYLWLRLDTMPVWGMGMPFLRQGLQWYHGFKAQGISSIIQNYLSFEDGYPPFMRCVYFIFYCLRGPDNGVDLMVNGFLSIIGILGIYAIGQFMFNKRTGLLAAVMWSAFPIVIKYAKSAYFQFPLMCMIPFLIYCWLRSDVFKSRMWSIMFGVIFAVMLQILPQGILFGILPMGHFLIQAINSIRSKQFDRHQLINVLITAAVVIIAGLHWYIIHREAFFTNVLFYRLLHYTSTYTPIVTPQVYGDFSLYFKDVLYYLRELSSGNNIPAWCAWQFFITTIVVMCGLSIRKFRTNAVKKIGYLILLFFIPFGFHSIIYLKGVPHSLGLLPLVALITVSGITVNNNRMLQHAITALLLSYGLIAQYLSLGDQAVSDKLGNFISHYSRSTINSNDIFGPLTLPERRGSEDGLVKVIDYISADYKNGAAYSAAQQARVLPVFSTVTATEVFHIVYYALRKNAPLAIECPEQIFLEHPLHYYDYIVLTRPYVMTSDNAVEKIKKEIVDQIDSDPLFFKRFTRTAEFEGFAEYKFVVFKKRGEDVGGD
jgi:hypothetical protein